MRPQVAWLAIVLVSLPSVAWADEPPSWSEFDVPSLNGRYLAEVRAKNKPEAAPRWTWQYQLTVFDTQVNPRQPLWLCDYTHDGYSGGYLSDDGTTFVYVNFWYEPEGAAVSIYRQGKLSRVVFGREFRIPASALKSTVSHQLWLDDSVSPNVRFVVPSAPPLWLEIHTVDKKTHMIDVESGHFMQP